MEWQEQNFQNSAEGRWTDNGTQHMAVCQLESCTTAAAHKQGPHCLCQVENPIPFSDSVATRTLSLGYLHAKYASLLLAPVQLSADWSFECIPLVEGLADPRNLLTLALYAWLLWTVMCIRPWRVAVELLTRLSGARPCLR